MANKIIRSVCLFTEDLSHKSITKLETLTQRVCSAGYEVQTKRICVPNTTPISEVRKSFSGNDVYISVGTLSKVSFRNQFEDFCYGKDVNVSLDLTESKIDLADVEVLFDIIKKAPDKTFSFTYVYNHVPSSPYFPSAKYERNGFSIGLQSTDLSADCGTLEEWFSAMSKCWYELNELFYDDDFLGIDSSVAPLFYGESSFINFIRRLGMDLSASVVTNTYTTITKFLKEANPRPVGLCGLMFPCLEDFELTEEYVKGNFSLERNIYLSLHSGLGIDTYPIGIDEKKENVLKILEAVQGLSNKYKKPLAIRFVSDGIAKIGEMTNFNNPYLKDVKVRPLF